jgi:hypothetical protein
MNSDMIGQTLIQTLIQTLEAVERLSLHAIRAGDTLVTAADGIALPWEVSALLSEVPPQVRSAARRDPNRRLA